MVVVAAVVRINNVGKIELQKQTNGEQKSTSKKLNQIRIWPKETG